MNIFQIESGAKIRASTGSSKGSSPGTTNSGFEKSNTRTLRVERSVLFSGMAFTPLFGLFSLVELANYDIIDFGNK